MQKLKQRNAVVSTSDEYNELVKQVKDQGGYVLHSFAIKNGLSVQYQVPV